MKPKVLGCNPQATEWRRVLWTSPDRDAQATKKVETKSASGVATQDFIRRGYAACLETVVANRQDVSYFASPGTNLCRRNVQLTFLFKSFNGKAKKRTLYTVLRSPHIDKKSREQFEIRIHQQRARLVVPMSSAGEMITEGAKIRINYNTYENENE